jgi:hypothetical protein
MSCPPPLSENKSSLELSLELRTSDDGGVLLDLEHDRLLKLNQVGVEIWNLLRSGDSEAEIVRKIAQKYSVNEQRVAKDVSLLLHKIAELQVTTSTSIVTEEPPLSPEDSSQPSYSWYGRDTNYLGPKPKVTTVLYALLGLAAFDLILSLFSMKSLCSYVTKWPVKIRSFGDSALTPRLCSAVERACVWYPKQALCLQRSAVTTCLLRSHGIPARMTIGVRPMPFVAHAWVEVDGLVVNDWPRVKTFYPSLSSY